VQWSGYLAFHETSREGVKDNITSGTTIRLKAFAGTHSAKTIWANESPPVTLPDAQHFPF